MGRLEETAGHECVDDFVAMGALSEGALGRSMLSTGTGICTSDFILGGGRMDELPSMAWRSVDLASTV